MDRPAAGRGQGADASAQIVGQANYEADPSGLDDHRAEMLGPEDRGMTTGSDPLVDHDAGPDAGADERSIGISTPPHVFSRSPRPEISDVDGCGVPSTPTCPDALRNDTGDEA